MPTKESFLLNPTEKDLGSILPREGNLIAAEQMTGQGGEIEVPASQNLSPNRHSLAEESVETELQGVIQDQEIVEEPAQPKGKKQR
jgi:hypothetical protein